MKYILGIISVFLFFSACVSEQKKALTHLLEVQGKLIQLKDARLNKPLAIEVLDLYNSFLEEYPDAENNAEILFNLGQVYRGLGKNLKALESFYLVHSKFPESPWAALAFFQQADCFEALDQRLTAKNTYEEFMEKYPSHPYLDQAMGMIQLLYLTDEELINKFEK
jgi:tetratricopeptide (TPR) repeat protein